MNTHHKSAGLCIIAAFFLIALPIHAQLTKPTIDTPNVGWGWFSLTMKGNSVTPKNTHWIITDMISGSTNFNTLRDCSLCTDDSCRARCAPGLTADTRDLTTKKIIGCAAGTTYSAMVRYNDGQQWSPYSNPILFMTPDEPAYTNEINILLWGHSTLTWDENTGVETVIREGNQGGDGFEASGGDSWGHSLQTELRRITGKRVVLTNRAMSGSRQSRWFRSGVGADRAIDHDVDPDYQNFDTTYDAGGTYADTKKYPIAVFVFAQNDARSGWCDSVPTYPVQYYESDVRKIVDILTAKGITIVYNSIHYAFPRACMTDVWYGAPYDRQLAYYDRWKTLMNEIPAMNSRVVKGFDFFSLFQSDTARYLSLDRIHVNLSEGIPGIVEPLARIVADAISKTTSVENEPTQPENIFLSQNFPNPFSESTTIKLPLLSAERRGVVSLKVFDLFGREVLDLSDEARSNSEVTILKSQLPKAGVYFYRLSTLNKSFTKAMVLIR